MVGTSYLGVLGIGAGYLAVGTLMSAMTRSQLVAVILTSVVLFGLFFAAGGGCGGADPPFLIRVEFGFPVHDLHQMGPAPALVRTFGAGSFDRNTLGAFALMHWLHRAYRGHPMPHQLEGAAIGSHTIRGRVVQDQLAVLDGVGCPARRFIWIHASAEPEISLNLEMARRGAFVEFDFVGSDATDQDIISRAQRMLDAGLGEHILLSQDRGWYDPAKPGGGIPQPYTYLPEIFLPKLRQAGLDEATVRQMTARNPFRAFAREQPA